MGFDCSNSWSLPIFYFNQILEKFNFLTLNSPEIERIV